MHSNLRPSHPVPDMHMRRHTLLLLILALAPSLARAQAKIDIVEGAKFSLGTVYRGAVVDHEVTIRNSGRDTLAISRVDVSCGCTGTLLTSDRIGPGATGKLGITFNSRNFRGAVHKTVTVNSNAANSPQLLIEFDGTVVEEMTIQPEYLWFQDADVGKKSRKTIAVKNEGDVPVELSGYSSDLAGLSAALPGKPLRPGESIDIPVDFTPEKSTPVVADRITIRTSHPRQKELVIPVYGNIRPAKGK